MILNLEQISLLLPVADESFDWQGVKFDIYLAKKFNTDQWQDESLRSLVLKCRESFYRYGKVALEDGYDNKSLICIVGASYLVEERLVKEWLTIRLVPAQGEPMLSEDLQVEFLDQKKLYELIKEKLFNSQENSAQRLFTISRFCGIAPYFQDSFQPLQNQKKIKFTALSFALLCNFSLKYINYSDKHVYITAMFHHNIFERIIYLKHNAQEAYLELPDTHETLSVHPDILKSFFPGDVVFRHPTYFFKIKELILWVKKMLSEGKINNDTLRLILKKEIDWDIAHQQLVNNKLAVVSQLSSLGDLLSGDEFLDDGLFTRKQLRLLLEEEVPKSLVLKLIHQSDLEQRVEKFLADLNFFNKYE